MCTYVAMCRRTLRVQVYAGLACHRYAAIVDDRAPPKRRKAKTASGTTPATDKITPPKDDPMVEVSLEAVKVPVSCGIVDAVPAEAVVHDVDPGAAGRCHSPQGVLLLLLLMMLSYLIILGFCGTAI
jgi:hypothetical protein